MSGRCRAGAQNRQVANEALALTRRMALVNLESALRFDDPGLRRIHLDMSRDDGQIAGELMTICRRNGWLPYPTTDGRLVQQTLAAQPFHPQFGATPGRPMHAGASGTMF